MSNENSFQSQLIKDLRELFPDAIVLKNDPNYLQGFPDILILYKNKWAALEVKKSKQSFKQANQEYYVDILDSMSFASFIYPENKEQILNELQQAFRIRRPTRLFRGK